MLLSFHVKCKKALDRENNCHSMGAYCPTLIAASHSFHTHDGPRKESHPYLESVSDQKGDTNY